LKLIGPSFASELASAGLTGLPFSWGSDGDICGAENLTPDQRTALDAVIAAHDPDTVVLAPVTPRQARLALLQAGLLDSVQAAVAAAGGATKITWDYATLFERRDPMILAIGQALGLTSTQIDDLFATAISL
jgi:hypothetical protein